MLCHRGNLTVRPIYLERLSLLSTGSIGVELGYCDGSVQQRLARKRCSTLRMFVLSAAVAPTTR